MCVSVGNCHSIFVIVVSAVGIDFGPDTEAALEQSPQLALTHSKARELQVAPSAAEGRRTDLHNKEVL